VPTAAATPATPSACPADWVAGARAGAVLPCPNRTSWGGGGRSGIVGGGMGPVVRMGY